MKKAALIIIALLTLSLGAFANQAGAPMPVKERHSVRHHDGYHIRKAKKHHIQKKKRAVREYKKYLKAKKHYRIQHRKMKKAERRFLRDHRKMSSMRRR